MPRTALLMLLVLPLAAADGTVSAQYCQEGRKITFAVPQHPYDAAMAMLSPDPRLRALGVRAAASDPALPLVPILMGLTAFDDDTAYPERDGCVRPEPLLDDAFHALADQPLVGHALVRLWLAHGRIAARIAAANALRSDYVEQEPEDVRALSAALEDADERARAGACWALLNQSGIDRCAAPALRRMLREARAHQRWDEAGYAATDLAEIRDGYPEAAADIVALAEEVPDQWAMISVITGLAAYPTAEGAAHAAWRILLINDLCWDPAHQILDANDETGLELALTAPDLADPAQRARAASALISHADLDLSEDRHAQACRRLLRDPDRSVRARAAMAMAGQAAMRPRLALPMLCDALKQEPDEPVQLRGLDAIVDAARRRHAPLDIDVYEDTREQLRELMIDPGRTDEVRRKASLTIDWLDRWQRPSEP
jgi:hypothetical protein